MTTVVLDASALIALLVDAGAVGVWVASQASANHLAVPDLALYETANILRRQISKGLIGDAEATLAHEDLRALPLELWPYSLDAQRIWQLRGSVTVYDAAYVAVAERLNADLVTLDRRLSRANGPTCQVLTPPGTITGQTSA